MSPGCTFLRLDDEADDESGSYGTMVSDFKQSSADNVKAEGSSDAKGKGKDKIKPKLRTKRKGLFSGQSIVVVPRLRRN